MLTLGAREGLRNARRDPALTVVLAGSTALALLVLAFVTAVAGSVAARMAQWESRVEVVVFVPPALDADRVNALRATLLDLPQVAGVAYTSSAEAWREFVADTGAPEDLVSAGEVGLLPGSFTLRLHRDAVDPASVDALVAHCRTIDGVSDVRYAADLLGTYVALRVVLRRVILLAALLTVAVLVGLGTATMRLALAGRRRELRGWMIEGATPRFLSVVFAIEGAVQGFLGSVAAAIVYLLAERLVVSQWGLTLPGSGGLVLALLAAGPALGVAAGLLATRRMGHLLAAALALALLAGSARARAAEAPPGEGARTTAEYDAEQQRRQLETLRKEREDAIARTETLAGRSDGLLEELESIGKIIDTLSKRIHDSKAKSDALAADIAAQEQRIATTQAAYHAAADQVVRLGRLLDWARAPGALAVLVEDTPQGETLRLEKVREVLLAARLKSFAQVERTQRELRAQRNTIAAAKAEADAVATALEADRATQAQAQEERLATLRALQTKQAVAAATVAEIEAGMTELERVLSDLLGKEVGTPTEAAHLGPVPFPDLRGVLPWPLKGATVARGFGRIVDPVFHTVTRHDGWLLTAPEPNARVRAVHEGRAEFVGWLPGYGKMIILTHGGGHQTLYGHCAQVFVTPGQSVHAGQVIATVGTTGPLEEPALYFAIRAAGRPEDPAAWLAPQKG